ncbi:hypothetical protein AB3X52_00350 [Nocardioides sp. DS6]|uniref:Uncharacterized protein n=1 Tax=Nocardioides eburneus TaxID=3231482 RepID=A0ABV3SSY6_9ACTN
MIRQSTFFIPPDIEARLLTGELVKHGGIVRTTTGQIYKHLKEIDLPRGGDSVAARAMQIARNPKVIVGSVAIVATIAAGGVTLAASRARKRSAVPECVNEYKVSLTEYLDAVREGRLDAGIIDRLISVLNALDEYSATNSSVTIELSPQQAAMLVQVVVDSTKQLTDENSIDIAALQAQVPATHNGNVFVDLRRRLEVQKQIFDQAS